MIPVAENNDVAPIVEAAGLTKIFRDFWGRPKARALNGVDFTVRRGQVFGLLGPNGSGKSTTVKLILGLLYPNRGTLRVLGHSPRNVDSKRHIGYLPEETYLYGYLTAAETLDFFGSLFGLPADERERRTQQLLEMVGLTHAARRPVGEFSKGMARRIGLAQALVNDPELVILDEPTSGLDPIGCREVKDIIRLLVERGKTVILSSHLLADVEDVCDEIVVLYGGRIRTQGDLHELLSVKNRTRITTPALDDETMADVRAALRNRVDEADIDIAKPSLNLEQFFLEIVQSAKREDVETAGVSSGGQIADYLRSDTTEHGEARLEALARSPLPTPATDEETEGTERENQQHEQTEARIRELVEPQTTTTNSESDADEESPAKAQTLTDKKRREVSERLKNLVQEDDDQTP